MPRVVHVPEGCAVVSFHKQSFLQVKPVLVFYRVKCMIHNFTSGSLQSPLLDDCCAWFLS